MAYPKPTKSAVDFRRGLPEGLEMFDVIEDPRSGNATRHPFGSMLFIARCALLSQRAVDAKNNAITAVPKLLRHLNLKGASVRVESRTTLPGGKVREGTRYCISSLAPDAAQHPALSRSHWAIENSCHWVLDVVSREDAARARCGDAAQHQSTLRRIALDPAYPEAIIGLRQMQVP